MNKSLAVIFLAFAVATLALRVEKKNGVDTYIFEQEINQTIQNVLANLSDPMEVEHYEMTLPEDASLTGTFSVDGLVVTGVKSLQIPELKVSILMNANVKAVIPKLTIKTTYAADLFYETNAVFGSGDADIELEDIEVEISTDVTLIPVSVKNLKVKSYLGAGKFAITGIMNNETLSQEISQELTDNGASFIDENQEAITDAISPVLELIVNAILESVLGGGDSVKIH